MVNPPTVSIVMPVYRSDIYLEEAIESIIKQTFNDFELLLIVDKPTFETRQIIKKYLQRDNRISAYYHETRLGLIDSLNYGCRIAKGKYIARMDSDDICLSKRLEKQIKFLEQHPDIGIVGSFIESINDKGHILNKIQVPSNPKAVRFGLIYYDCIVHPSIVIRKNILNQLNCYSKNAFYVEDYDLWIRASTITDIANIPEVLLKYRIHESNTSISNLSLQEESTIVLIQRNINNFYYNCSLEDIKNFREMFRGSRLKDVNTVKRISKLVKMIYQGYLKSTLLDDKEINSIKHEYSKLILKLSISAVPICPFDSFFLFLYAFSLDAGIILLIIKKIFYDSYYFLVRLVI
jgi:glycosyltransferase involved in cell wall biosynthesis